MNLGHFIQRAGLALVAGIVLFDPHSAAAVRFEVVAGNVDGGKVDVSVVLRSEGSPVGGGQNDLLYDTTIIDLERTSSCRIAPEIGDRLPNC